MSATYDPRTYRDRWAGVYDDWHEARLARDTVEAVAFLQRLAAGGPALELGIGTGRIALPLSEQGVPVHGVEASRRMVAGLRRKPGGRRIRVTVGDFGLVPVEGRFALAYVVFNTLFALPSQEAQVRCFRNVARRLRPGAAFVVQAFVPDVTRFRNDQRVGAWEVGVDSLRFEASLHDPIEQRVIAQHVVLTEGAPRLYPVELRYAFPAELDLMARLAGLRLRQRHAGWRGEPFTAQSAGHVSVYERPAGDRRPRGR